MPGWQCARLGAAGGLAAGADGTGAQRPSGTRPAGPAVAAQPAPIPPPSPPLRLCEPPPGVNRYHPGSLSERLNSPEKVSKASDVTTQPITVYAARQKRRMVCAGLSSHLVSWCSGMNGSTVSAA